MSATISCAVKPLWYNEMTVCRSSDGVTITEISMDHSEKGDEKTSGNLFQGAHYINYDITYYYGHTIILSPAISDQEQ